MLHTHEAAYVILLTNMADSKQSEKVSEVFQDVAKNSSVLSSGHHYPAYLLPHTVSYYSNTPGAKRCL